MKRVDFNGKIIEFPDNMNDEQIDAVLKGLTLGQVRREKPDEEVEEKLITPRERYAREQALSQANPLIANGVRKMALQKRTDFDFSWKKTIGNIPRNIDDIVNGLASLIVGTGIATYKFGKNIRDDGNEAIRNQGHPILPMTGPRIQEQAKPISDLANAICYDWKSMFAGEVTDEIGKLPVGQMRDAVFDKVERVGLGNALEEFIQTNPVDAMLFALPMVKLTTGATKLTVVKVSKAVPKGTRIATALENVLSTKRTPIVYKIAGERKIAEVTSKQIKADTMINGKPFSAIVEEIAKNPGTSKELLKGIPGDFAIEALRNQGMSLMGKLSKGERPLVAANLQKALDGIKRGKVPAPADKVLTFERSYSSDLLMKYVFQKSFDKVLESYPKMRKYVEEHRAKKLLNNLRNAYEDANFKERAAMHENVFKQIEALSADEQKLIVPYLEGRARLISEPSEQLKNFEKWYRDVVNDYQAGLIKGGKLTQATIDERMYQPLVKATGLDIGTIRAELGDFSPVYVHHYFPEIHKAKKGIHFAETTGKRYIPGFLKKSKGVGGYSENMAEILPKWTSEYVKFKNTEKFIEDFTSKFGIKVNIKDVKEVAGGLKVGDKIYKDYKIVAPDNYLSYYRGKVDIYKEVMERTKNFTFDEAIGEVLSKSLTDPVKFIGVSKNKTVYLVPAKMTGELESLATPFMGSQKAQHIVRLVVDKPTQVWKDSVLGLSPRWIKNNIVGDVILNSFEGVGPLSYSRAFRTIYKDCIPDELLSASFANVMKYNPKLGSTAETAVGTWVQKCIDSKVFSKAGKAKDFGYALNTMLEQPFVRSLYIKIARDKAISLCKIEGLKANEVNILNKMRVIKGDAKLLEPIVSKVKETLPVFNLLGNFERKYIRRFVPFYNWYKFMAIYGIKLPAKHPFKLAGARGLGALAEENRESVFKKYFPFMAREISETGIPNRFDHLWPVGEPGEKETTFFNSRGTNPFTTISDFANLDLVNTFSPVIKIPLEQMTGRQTFSDMEYKTGEEGVVVSRDGVKYFDFEKARPPLFEHIASQFPQYQLLDQMLVPARQWETGTILNPDPILDPITGEYKYPIKSVERLVNMLGIDRKTLDVQKTYYQYIARKHGSIKQYFLKHGQNVSLREIKEYFGELVMDDKTIEQIKKEIKWKAEYEASLKLERMQTILTNEETEK